MLGYYRMPKEISKTIRNGWLRTRDMGPMEGDGFLYIVQCKKDLIIRGGFNIYPREVEEVLYAHPRSRRWSSRCSIRDPLMGEDVLAFVVLMRDEQANEEEIMAFCQERLANYYVV
jgi:long-chain acyl-CoA synthetase